MAHATGLQFLRPAEPEVSDTFEEDMGQDIAIAFPLIYVIEFQQKFYTVTLLHDERGVKNGRKRKRTGFVENLDVDRLIADVNEQAAKKVNKDTSHSLALAATLVIPAERRTIRR